MAEALIAQSCLTFVTPWTVAHQDPSVHGTSQASILELPFSSVGDLPDPGIEPTSPAAPAWQANSLSLVPLGKLQL